MKAEILVLFWCDGCGIRLKAVTARRRNTVPEPFGHGKILISAPKLEQSPTRGSAMSLLTHCRGAAPMPSKSRSTGATREAERAIEATVEDV